MCVCVCVCVCVRVCVCTLKDVTNKRVDFYLQKSCGVKASPLILYSPLPFQNMMCSYSWQYIFSRIISKFFPLKVERSLSTTLACPLLFNHTKLIAIADFRQSI